MSSTISYRRRRGPPSVPGLGQHFEGSALSSVHTGVGSKLDQVLGFHDGGIFGTAMLVPPQPSILRAELPAHVLLDHLRVSTRRTPALSVQTARSQPPPYSLDCHSPKDYSPSRVTVTGTSAADLCAPSPRRFYYADTTTAGTSASSVSGDTGSSPALSASTASALGPLPALSTCPSSYALGYPDSFPHSSGLSGAASIPIPALLDTECESVYYGNASEMCVSHAEEEDCAAVCAREELTVAAEVDDDGTPFRVGDILSFRRHLYSHDAVYVGQGQIVHLWNADDSADFVNAEVSSSPATSLSLFGALLNLWSSLWGGRSPCTRAQVVLSSIADIKWDCHMRVRANRKRLRLSREEIVERAKSAIGRRCEYHVIFRNCQHFATWSQGHVVASRDLSNYISLVSAVYVAGSGLWMGRRYQGVHGAGSVLGFSVGLFIGALAGVLGMFSFDLSRDSTGGDGHLLWLKEKESEAQQQDQDA